MEVQTLNPSKIPPSPETNNNPFANNAAHDDKTNKRRKRRNICLGTTAAAIILIVLIMLILALTVFKAKKPVTTMENVSLRDLSMSLDITNNRTPIRLNLTLDVDMAIKNPNKVGVKLSAGNSASLIYRGEQVGEIPIPAGKISADSTTPMNMTMVLMADRLLSRSQLYSDVLADVIPVNVYARIKAKVSIFKIFKIGVTSVTTCDITVFVSNRTVGQQNCNSKTKF
ncbi:hypothetical protein LINPERHAP2_LOCUS15728 [Linum perenne]